MVKPITRLEQRRRKLGLTQRDLARKLGVKSTLISLVETGRLKAYPRFRRRVAEILECDETYLFGKD